MDNVNDYMRIGTSIEASTIAELEWGTARAKNIVISGTYRGGNDTYAFAQTYCLAVLNGTKTRSYVTEIGSSASGVADFNFTAVIPGDTSLSGGYWFPSSGIVAGMHIYVVSWAGTALRTATPNTWLAGAFYGTANMVFPTLNIFSFGQVTKMGLYVDPYKTGVAPPFEVPDYYKELRRCQRYWTRIYGARGWQTTTTAASRMGVQFPVPMRIAPAFAVVGTPKVNDGTTSVSASAVASSQSNAYAGEIALTTPALVAARPASHIWDVNTSYIAASARL